MKTITLGVFTNTDDAESALSELLKKEISRDSISYLYTNKSGRVEEHKVGEVKSEKEEAIKSKVKAEDTGAGLASGATTGGVLGALAGLAVTSGVLPGLGALFIGGPLVAALGLGAAAAVVASGAVTGAAAGTLAGALTGYGLSEPDAHIYEEQITKGNIFVSVDCPDPKGDILEVLNDNDAIDIKQYNV